MRVNAWMKGFFFRGHGNGGRSLGRMIGVLLCVILSLGGTACQGTVQTAERQVWCMDTWVTVRLYEGAGESDEDILAASEERMRAWEERLSVTLPGSEISAFRQREGRFTFTPETAELIRQALDVAEATGGAFDPTVAPLMRLWKTAQERQVPPTEAELDAVRPHIGYAHLSMTGDTVVCDDPAVELDLGGIGKGYVMDRVREQLVGAGVSSALISCGSNVAVVGNRPDGKAFRIGIRDPADPEGILGYVQMDGSLVLSVSGDYERYYTIAGEHYGHILDPRTGYPPRSGCHSVAVLCEDGALADALSTALMVCGEEGLDALRERYAFEVMFVYEDGITVTDGWRERFTGYNGRIGEAGAG